MGNIVLGYNNRSDNAVFTGGSWDPNLTVDQLAGNTRANRVIRTVDSLATSTVIIADLGAAYNIGCVGICKHNLSAAATVRVRADNTGTTFASPTYDSTALAAWAGGVIPTDLTEWQNDNFWLATLSSQGRAGFRAPYTLLITAQPSVRYVRIDINDTTNTDNYFQIGKLMLAATWTPGINYEYSAGLGYEDSSSPELSVGGSEFFDIRGRYRVMNIAFQWLTENEAYQQVLVMQRLVGSTGDILVVPDPSDTTNGVRRNFVGHMRKMSPMVFKDASGRYSYEMEIRERT